MDGKDFWKAFAVPLGLLIVFVLAFWGLYVLTRNVNIAKTPTIEITSGSEIVTNQTEVPITGVVTNSDKLTVNGKDIPLAEGGGFTAVVPVVVGENNIEIAAGDNAQTKSSVKITREEVAQSITATSTSIDTDSAGLSTSGPAEVAMGSFGLAAILLACGVYVRSIRQNSLQTAQISL